MIKDILVNLSASGTGHDPAVVYAVALGEMLGAHVTGLGFRVEHALQPSAFGFYSPKIVAATIKAEKEANERAGQFFAETCRRAGIAHESSLQAATLTDSADRFGAAARRFDLSVIRQVSAGDDAQGHLVLQAALFDSGRPVIIVPYIQKAAPRFDRIAVCWDGGRAAARAVADALPLLARAKTIDIVIVKSEKLKSEEFEGADIATHLARHGLKVNVAATTRGDLDVGNIILNYVADHSIDFLVMGGYGHSRLRETVLGGATRTLVESMTVPTLMAH